MDTIVVCFSPSAERPMLRKLMEEYSAKVDSARGLNLPPHVTIVSRFKTQHLQEFLEQFKLLCRNLRPFSIHANQISAFEDSGTIVANFAPSKELQRIHEKILKLASKYREPWIREKLAEVKKNARQEELTKKYGSPFVMEYYTPHLSLTGADVNKKKLTPLKLPKKFELTLKVDNIHILQKTGEEWKIYTEIPFG